MATLFTHSLVGAAIGSLAPQGSRGRMALLGALCACLPDLDVLAFYFGIPYGHLLGHRGLSHSFFAALLIGLAAARLVDKPPYKQAALLLVMATASHGVLDAFTDGGLGVAFFSPFDTTRYFFPWQPLKVSPLGASFFSARGWTVIQSELLWIWLPLLPAWGILRYVQTRQKRQEA